MTMILWCIFALMTAAAIFAVVWPLGRRPSKPGGGSDLVVYRDQLQEIDRDREAGLIGEAEAETARLEVSRRLLAAADTQPPSAPVEAFPADAAAPARGSDCDIDHFAARCRRVFTSRLGRPTSHGSPPSLAWIPAKAASRSASLVSKVEAHLASNPNDGSGWEVIAPVYMRLGRFDDAVAARKKSLALNGESAHTSSRPRRSDHRCRRRRRHRRGQGGVRDALLRTTRTK